MTQVFQFAAQAASDPDGIVSDIINGRFERVRALEAQQAAIALVPAQSPAVIDQPEPAPASDPEPQPVAPQPNGRLVTFLYLLAMYGLPAGQIESILKQARRHDDAGAFRFGFPSAGIGEWAKQTAKALEGGKVAY